MKPIYTLVACGFLLLQAGCAPSASDGWISLFDGQTMNGWQAAENPDTWHVEDGALVTHGERSHLFYTGDVEGHTFKNFAFSADVMTTPGSNSGIYFHTEYQDSGWPSKGYEAQVINSSRAAEPGAYVEHKMTGSLYAIRNVWKTPARDNEWFNYRIVVQGKTVRIYINDLLTVDYTEPDPPVRPEELAGRVLSSGTFALQGHDPGSTVYFKNIKVKPLPDDAPTPGKPMDDPAFEARLLALAAANFPLIDLHVHLKEGLTMDQALANARLYGYTYGFAVNAGLQMGMETDEELRAYLADYQKPPHTYLAMQAEGREWRDMFAPETVDRFDYVFTDAMTWTNDDGKRMRLWIEDETEVGDPQAFMEQLVDRIETIVRNEPVDIYVNPTYIPDEINDRYDELWTEERMDRVINALVESGVPMEINNRRRIPSAAFIQRAKAAGVKFTFGTNNAGPDDLGRMDYAIEMIEACGLTPDDMWMPED